MLNFRILSFVGLLLISTPVFGAVNFDGVDDNFNCPDTTSLNLHGGNQITISAWINLNTDVTTTTEKEFTILRRGGGANANLFTVDNDGVANENYIVFGLDTGAFLSCRDTDGPFIVPGQWHHVIGTYWSDNQGGNGQEIYIDGVLSKTCADLGDLDFDTFDHWCIGRNGSNTNGACDDFRYMDGKIEDLFLGDEVVTARQAQLLASGIRRIVLQPEFASSIRAYWPMDEHAEGVSVDGLDILDNSLNTNFCDGSDGANNTGLTGFAGRLAYP